MKILKISALIFLVMFTAGTVSAAWVAPTGNPTTGNPPAPVNVGSTDQTKSGGLTVGGLISSFIGVSNRLEVTNATTDTPGTAKLVVDKIAIFEGKGASNMVLASYDSYGNGRWVDPNTIPGLGGLPTGSTNQVLRNEGGSWVAAPASVTLSSVGTFSAPRIETLKIVPNKIAILESYTGDGPSSGDILVSADGNGNANWRSPSEIPGLGGLPSGSNDDMLRHNGSTWEAAPSSFKVRLGETPAIVAPKIVTTDIAIQADGFGDSAKKLLIKIDGGGNAVWKTPSEAGIALPQGDATNQLLRWDGSKWVRALNAYLTSLGDLSIQGLTAQSGLVGSVQLAGGEVRAPKIYTNRIDVVDSASVANSGKIVTNYIAVKKSYGDDSSPSIGDIAVANDSNGHIDWKSKSELGLDATKPEFIRLVWSIVIRDRTSLRNEATVDSSEFYYTESGATNLSNGQEVSVSVPEYSCSYGDDKSCVFQCPSGYYSVSGGMDCFVGNGLHVPFKNRQYGNTGWQAGCKSVAYTYPNSYPTTVVMLCVKGSTIQ